MLVPSYPPVINKERSSLMSPEEARPRMRALSSGTAAAVVLFAFVVCCVAARQNSSAERIRIFAHEAERRADVVIDGQRFTAYIWPEELAKPVLYPLRTARGTVV